MSFRLEYSKQREKKTNHARWEQRVSHFIRKSLVSKRNVQPLKDKYMQMLIITIDLCCENKAGLTVPTARVVYILATSSEQLFIRNTWN